MTDWIRCSVDELDLQRQGVNHYLLAIEYSWKGEQTTLEYPLTVAHTGDGPCALLLGGTHGDEFEGQLAATRLASAIQVGQVHGTLIVVPTHNRPAALAGVRTSPIDGFDMNRIYPGADGEGPSYAIARFVTQRLIACADTVIDIHSGGTTHEFVLSSNLQGRVGPPQYFRDLPALLSFNTPYAIVFDEAGNETMPHKGSVEAAAQGLGKRAFSTELGGARRLTPDSLEAAETGIRNLLRHIGILNGPVVDPAQSRSKLLCLSRPEQYIGILERGQFVPHVWLGAEVSAGQLLGEVHYLDRPGTKPYKIYTATSGIVVTVASAGIVDPLEPAYVVAQPIER